MRPWPRAALVSLAVHIATAAPTRGEFNGMRPLTANHWRWLPWAAAFVLIALIATRFV